MLDSFELANDTEFKLRGLCDAWNGLIERARKHKKPWQEVADECDMFYSAASGFLWDDKYKWKFWNTSNSAVDPTFKITIARAFELVALFGPSLYWANPVRTAKPQDLIEVPPDVFGDVQQDPMAAQLFQQAQQKYQAESLQRNMAAQLQARVLNHTPDLLELNDHSDRAITDLLIKGRGVLVTEPYRHPGSGKLLIGSFYETPDRVFMDPDCERARDAWWVAVEKQEPYWEVERKFGLSPPGVLRKWANHQSATAQGQSWGQQHYRVADAEASGKQNDQVRYYEIYSRMGVGIRGIDLPTPYQQAMESVGGNFCYMAVSPGVPFLLNCPDWVLGKGYVEDVRKRLQWPIPFWTEGKFPVNLLDVYQRTRYPWPLPPLAPGLGELKAINIFMCSLLHHVWMSSRTLIGVLESAKEEVEKVLKKGQDFAVFGVQELNKNMEEVVQFLEHPPVRKEVWDILSALMQMFDRRVGLTDLLYGQQATQSRSATDVKTRQSNLSIRPQDMARRVAAWQTQVARREAFGLWYKCKGEDVSDILGETGGWLWDRYVRGARGEQVVRQIDYRVEASTMARPNRDLDSDNLQNFLQVFGPVHQGYFQSTGNPQQINALQNLWGETSGMNVKGLMFEPPPPPDPSQNPELQKAQMEMQKIQMEAQMEAQKAQLDLQKAQADLQQQVEAFRIEQQQRAQEHGQEMTQDQERHLQEMRQKGQELAALIRENHLKLQQMEEAGRVKLEIARKQAAARPKPAKTNGKAA